MTDSPRNTQEQVDHPFLLDHSHRRSGNSLLGISMIQWEPFLYPILYRKVQKKLTGFLIRLRFEYNLNMLWAYCHSIIRHFSLFSEWEKNLCFPKIGLFLFSGWILLFAFATCKPRHRFVVNSSNVLSIMKTFLHIQFALGFPMFHPLRRSLLYLIL